MTNDAQIDGLLEKLARTAHDPRAPKFHRHVAAIACRAVREQRGAGLHKPVFNPPYFPPKIKHAPGAVQNIEAARPHEPIPVFEMMMPSLPPAIDEEAPLSPSWPALIALSGKVGALWLAGGAALFGLVYL